MKKAPSRITDGALGLKAIEWCCDLGLGGIHLDNAQGNAADDVAVDGDVHGVVAGFFKAQALEVHDQVTGEERSSFRKGNGQVSRDGHAFRIKGLAVFVNNGNAKLVVAGVFWGHAKAEGQGAHRMDDGCVLSKEGIECALEAKLALIVGGVVAENGSLDVHGRNQYILVDEKTPARWGRRMNSLSIRGLNFELQG